MATIPSITPNPQPYPFIGQSKNDFNANANYLFSTHMTTNETEMNNTISVMNSEITGVNSNTGIATTKASEASASAAAALVSENNASTSEAKALASEQAAASSIALLGDGQINDTVIALTNAYSNQKVDELLAGGTSETASPKSFGAVGDGVTDDTAAITSAIASGKTVDFGSYGDIYLISSSLTLNAGQVLKGSGATLKTVSNINMIVMTSDCVIENLTFLGNSTGATQRGVFIDGGVSFNAVSRTRTINCTFKNLGGVGYYVTRVVNNHEGNQLSSSTFRNCGTGIDIAERGEYQVVSGCNVDTCTIGISIVGGNSVISGSVFSDCDTNVYLGAGGNDAHGAITGCAINHGVNYSIHADNPNAAFLFSGCNIYAGNLLLNKTNQFKFNSCTFGSVVNFYFQGSVDDVFSNCSFVTSLPNFNHNYLAESSKTHFVNCDGSDLSTGTSPFDLNGGYLSVERAGSNANLSSANAEQILTFNTLVYNALSNNLNYTYESMYSVNTTFDVKNKIKSPNKSFYVDVDIQISIGVTAGAIDYDKINVYLKDTEFSATVTRYEAIFASTPFESGSNPGVSWRVYTLKGRVKRGIYQIAMINESGVAPILFRNQGDLIPCNVVFSNI